MSATFRRLISLCARCVLATSSLYDVQSTIQDLRKSTPAEDPNEILLGESKIDRHSYASVVVTAGGDVDARNSIPHLASTSRHSLIRAEAMKNTSVLQMHTNRVAHSEKESSSSDESIVLTAQEALTSDKLVLAKGWTTRGKEYGEPKWSTRVGFCFLTGAIKGSTWALLATLPEKCRPSKQLVFNQNAGAVTARVEVYKNGQVHYKGGEEGRKAGWVSLSGIVFGTASVAKSSLALGWQWRGVGGVYGTPSYSLHKGFCLLEGAVKEGNFGAIGVLPEECFPRKRLAFNVNNGDVIARVDVLADGQIQWVAGGKNKKMLSLSGIMFETVGGEMENLFLQGDWQGFWGEFGGATISARKGICTIEAMMKGNHWGHIATLPANCRPRSRLVFNVNNNQFTTQVDVFPDGTLKYLAGGKAHSFISLSNVMFPVKEPVLRGPQGEPGVNAPALIKVDCEFLEWMDWDACTVSCAGGSKRRERAIKVWPQNNGKNCPGANLEIAKCKSKPCPSTTTTTTSTTTTGIPVKALAASFSSPPLMLIGVALAVMP